MGKYEILWVLVLLFSVDISRASMVYRIRDLFINAAKMNFMATHQVIRSLSDEGSDSNATGKARIKSNGSNESSITGSASSSRAQNDPESTNGSTISKNSSMNYSTLPGSNSTNSSNPPEKLPWKDGSHTDVSKQRPLISLPPQPHAGVNATGMEAGNCERANDKCTDGEKITACVRIDRTAILIQNDGGSAVKVNLTVPMIANSFRQIELFPHETKVINISVVGVVVVNAGGRDCVLRLAVGGWRFFVPVSSYAGKALTPTGAAFAAITAFMVAGTWACWKWKNGRSRRGGGGGDHEYRELEMGVSGLAPAVSGTSAAADDWDSAWDDDWESVGKTVVSPDSTVKDPSTAGRISRPPSVGTGEWEKNWDD